MARKPKRRPELPTPTPVPTPAPPTTNAPDSVAVRVTGNPNNDPHAAREVHGKAVAGAVYGNALRQRIAAMFSGPIAQSAMLYVDDLVDRMAPRDPAEEMLVIQMVLAHARVLHLTDLANRQERLVSIRAINEHADRASNTFRRLMLALSDYRRPRAPAAFTAIRQANIAGQQVIQNHETQNTPNELGFLPLSPQALPPFVGGAGCAPCGGPAGEAVDPVHRPSHARGKGPGEGECHEAR